MCQFKAVFFCIDSDKFPFFSWMRTSIWPVYLFTSKMCLFYKIKLKASLLWGSKIKVANWVKGSSYKQIAVIHHPPHIQTHNLTDRLRLQVLASGFVSHISSSVSRCYITSIYVNVCAQRKSISFIRRQILTEVIFSCRVGLDFSLEGMHKH